MGKLINGKVVLSCDFCGKSQNEVEAMMAGLNAYVCSECVEMCAEILEAERERKSSVGGERTPGEKEE